MRVVEEEGRRAFEAAGGHLRSGWKPILFPEGSVKDRSFVKVVSRQIMQHIIEAADESRKRLQAPCLWPLTLDSLVPAR